MRQNLVESTLAVSWWFPGDLVLVSWLSLRGLLVVAGQGRCRPGRSGRPSEFLGGNMAYMPEKNTDGN